MISKFNHPEHNWMWTDIEVSHINALINEAILKERAECVKIHTDQIKLLQEYMHKALEDTAKTIRAFKNWKEAVIDELVVCHIYSDTHDNNPRLAISDAINWNVSVALDPQVSNDAQSLIDRGIQQERTRIIKDLFDKCIT